VLCLLAVPFRASINRVLVVTARASLSPAELCRRVISRPFQAAQSLLQQKRNGHAIVVRENNTITHEMALVMKKDSTEPATQGNDFQTILGRFRTQMTTKPTNTFVSCHLYGSVP
jgi:hypothetical protein